MRSGLEKRPLRRALGCAALLAYLVLTFAGSFHRHDPPVDHCGASCPAGHGESTLMAGVGPEQGRHVHPSFLDGTEAGEHCRLCDWATASRTGALQAILYDTVPAPSGFVRDAAATDPDSISLIATRPRGPPGLASHTTV